MTAARTRAAIAIAASLALAGAAVAAERSPLRPPPAANGVHVPGEAVGYGPHREGQRPGGPNPTRAEVREDLALIARHWRMVRTYGAIGTGDTVLAAIRESGLPIRVLLGAWLAAEDRRDSTGRVLERFPAARAANRRELDHAVALARRYPEQVAAIVVGNENQVFWTGNKVARGRLLEALRETRRRTRVPVTTGDDYNFWNKPESRAVADACDFVLVHLHPLWNGVSLEGAVPWVETQLAAIDAAHPARPVVIGETGWATRRNDAGDQGKLMKGALGEAEQASYLSALRAWLRAAGRTAFVFEAFDENWKGSADPADVEKHWGLYRADRTPKPAAEADF